MLLFAVLLGVVVALVIAMAVIPAEQLRGSIVGGVIFATSSGSTPVAPTEVRESVLWGSVLALVIASLSKRRSPRRKPLVPLLIVVFFGISLIVSAVAYPDGTSALLRIALLAVMLTVVGQQFTDQDRNRALALTLLTAIAQALLGVAEFATGGGPALWGYGVRIDGTSAIYGSTIFPGLARVQGTMGHPIPYATILAFGLVILVARWPSWPRTFRAFALLTLGAGLLLSGTRSAFLALCVSLCYMLLLSRSGHRLRNFSFAAVLIGVATAYGQQIRDSVEALVNSGSFENRASGIESVSGLLTRAPLEAFFGSGWGSEPQLFAAGYLQQNGFGVVDNQFITTLATQGALGFVLLAGIFIAGIWRGDRTRRGLVLLLLVMGFSFDYLRWTSIDALLFRALALPAASEWRDLDADTADSADERRAPGAPAWPKR